MKTTTKIKTLLITAEKMRRYRRYSIVHQHYAKVFESLVDEIKKQLPYAPHRELFESIVPYIRKGEIPPIIWGGSNFQYNLLRKVGDTFYTHLSEYNCFEKFCCYGDEAAEGNLLKILNQLYTLGIIFIPTGMTIRAVIM